MTAAVVYDGVAHTSSDTGTLFKGLKLWFGHAVPQRKWLIENAEANGAEIVPLEKQADILLVDHAKKNAAPGTHSYRYVELSIRNGVLEDVADHVVGARDRASRIVGSVSTAAKGTRTAFTEADDQLLWDWVKPYEDAGEKTAGNEIYKQLERVDGRHTYQSWRNRWLKTVCMQDRKIERTQFGDLVNEPAGMVKSPNRSQRDRSAPRIMELGYQPSEGTRERSGRGARDGRGSQKPSDVATELPLNSQVDGLHEDEEAEKMASRRAQQPRVMLTANTPAKAESLKASPSKHGRSSPVRQSEAASSRIHVRMPSESSGNLIFTGEEAALLLNAAEHILNSDEDRIDEAWAKVATMYPTHTADEWKTFFHAEVAPAYERRRTREKQTNSRFHAGEKVDEEADHRDASMDRRLEPQATPVEPRHANYVERGTSPMYPDETGNLRHTKSARSPSFQPDTPTAARAPEPNEARKRSASRSTKSNPNSQESKPPINVHNVNGASGIREIVPESAIAEHGKSSPSKRRRGIEDDGRPASPEVPSIEDILIMTPRLKRIKRMHSEIGEHKLDMEIPSTPPSVGPGSRVLPVSTPSARRSVPRHVEAREGTASPLFMPQDQSDDGLDEDDKLHLTHGGSESVEAADDKDEDRGGHTSPLSVKLISDQDGPTSSMFEQSQSHRSSNEADDDSDVDITFETARDVSQVWETAPEQIHPVGRLETQALFERDEGEMRLLGIGVGGENVDEEMMFALPEPDGGWFDEDEEAGEEGKAVKREGHKVEDVVEIQQSQTLTVKQKEGPSATIATASTIPTIAGLNNNNGKPQSRIPPHTQTSRQPPSIFPEEEYPPSASTIDVYIDTHMSSDPDCDEEYLLMAIDATCMDTHLVQTVYNHLNTTKGVLPVELRGCWTAKDDQSLEGGDAAEVERVEKKHGGLGVDRRWMWRESGGR